MEQDSVFELSVSELVRKIGNDRAGVQGAIGRLVRRGVLAEAGQDAANKPRKYRALVKIGNDRVTSNGPKQR